jgi:predicted negative regulator of RcsB-dependent stress response
VPGYSKRQLKEDRFKTSAADAVHWTEEHRQTLIVALIASAVILAAVVGGWAYIQHRNEVASFEVGQALRTLSSPIVAPGQPVAPGIETYTSIKERAVAARKKFLDIAHRYSHTEAGRYSRYMAATTAMDAGDNAAAESELKALADSGDKNLASLAKLALASLYRNTGKTADATRIYKELMEKPTDTVPKTTAELELAGMYETTQPAEAVKMYQQIQKDDPKAVAAQVASERLSSVQNQKQ